MAESPEKLTDLTQRFRQVLSHLSDREKEVGAESFNEEKERYNFECDKAFKQEAIIAARHRNKALENKNNLFEQNTELRKKYAKNIFILTCFWASAIILILLLVAANNWDCFYLSDRVILTLITSTTVNIYGFFLLVVKYLFPSPKTKTKSKSESAQKIKDLV